MLQLQGQSPAPAKSQWHASTLLTWGRPGESAESTERDQLAGERNVRECADSLVATDHTGAQQHIHTADYWLHIYTPMWPVFAHSRRLQSYDCHVTCVDEFGFALCLCTLVQTGRVHFSSRSAQVGFLLPHFVLLSLTQLCLFLKQNTDDCISVLVHTMCCYNLLDL